MRKRTEACFYFYATTFNRWENVSLLLILVLRSTLFLSSLRIALFECSDLLLIGSRRTQKNREKSEFLHFMYFFLIKKRKKNKREIRKIVSHSINQNTMIESLLCARSTKGNGLPGGGGRETMQSLRQHPSSFVPPLRAMRGTMIGECVVKVCGWFLHENHVAELHQF
jgi:hypothetical protein